MVIPNKTEREYINKVIFDELCAGKILQKSKERFIQIIARLAEDEGAEGVILGCTEIPLLVKQEDVSVPVFDTTAIHSEAAVRYSLNGKSPSGGRRMRCRGNRSRPYEWSLRREGQRDAL